MKGMSQPKGYVDSDYLQVTAKLGQQTKQRSYTYMHAQPGQKLLDVGCGPGTDTIPLAQLVGPTGQVVGVDYDQAMIVEANQRAEQAGISASVKHKHADVASDETEKEALTAGIITRDELQRWHASLERADSEGVFFGSGSMVLVAGRKT